MRKNASSNEVVIKNTLWCGGFLKTTKRISIVIGGAAFVVIGLLMVFNSGGIGDTIWGLVLAIGGGFGLYAIIDSMIQGTVIATISDRGVDVADKAFVPWEHVKSFKKEVDGIINQAVSGPGSNVEIVYYEDGDVEKLRSVMFDSGYSSYTNEGAVKVLDEFYERYKSNNTGS